MIKHEGYTGEFMINLDAGVVRGRVLGMCDVITFQGVTVEQARTAIIDSADDYLAFCAERGESPERPDLGQVLSG